MQLSSKEREYRYKIIAENHFKKDAQRYIDFYVTENKSHSINITYKYIYSNCGLLHHIMIKYNLNKIGNAIRDMGASCVKATNAFRNLASSLSKMQ